MSALPPRISEWNNLGLEWSYIDQAHYQPLTLNANYQFQLPIEDYTFSYPEGILLSFTVYFDHPSCGIRIVTNPEHDSQDFLTVENISRGITSPENHYYALVPPITKPGVFGIRLIKPMFFTKWMELYLINTDSSSHRSLSQEYHIAVLKENIPRLNKYDVELSMLISEIYPKSKEALKKELRDTIRKWLIKKDIVLEI